MRRISRRIAPLVALSVVVAACGGGSDDGGDADGAETTEAAESGDTETTEAAESGDTETTEAAGDMEPIRVGMLADLSGAFAGLVTEIAAAQEVYWDAVNAEGGIDGHPVELIIEDTGYDVAVTAEKYEGMRESVDIISLSTGSPHTANLAPLLAEDHMLALPLSWYSGWAFEGVGTNAVESYTNYCLESMNGVEWVSTNKGATKVAIISFPGEYGQDGAAGAKKAAEALGLEVVYDGEGLVTPPSADNPNPDQSGVISEIVSANPDFVWATVNPATLGAIMGGAAAQGFLGMWSGNSPSYSYKMLANDQIAPVLDALYIQSTYVTTWGADVPGMADMIDKMTAARPDLPISDAYILGWTEAMTTEAILRQAAANGDLSREGIEAALADTKVDFQGLAPDQTWSGDPNDYVVRESYIYDVDLASYSESTLAEGTGSAGSVLLAGPYVGDVAANYDFTEPCFVSG